MRWWPWKNRDEDLARELQSDLELEEEEQQEIGLSAEEARFAAVRAFGNPTVIREQTRAVWTWNWLERLLRNLKYGVRTLWRSPSFSIVSVLVMALGIGATTSLFTIVRAVLLRPLPFRDPGRLVMLYDHFRHDERGDGFSTVAAGDYRDWRAQSHGFEDMAAMRAYGGIISGVQSELPEVVESAAGSANLFPLLGVSPVLGRTFTDAEDQPEGQPVVLLTCSNLFMTVAWYGHLKFKSKPLLLVILVSWGIAFFEYVLQVPANRWGSNLYSAYQLKILQEIITLAVFVVFALLYFGVKPAWNHVAAFICILAAVAFAFLPKS